MTEGPSELLSTLRSSLEAAAIPFMVVGSYASMAHGHPRTTHDLDIVIDPTPAALDVFLAGLDLNRFYVDTDVARDALVRRSMFNLIDMNSAWKVDFVIRKDRPFSVEELQRRVVMPIADVDAPTATAEDTVIAKLEWAKLGGSERQLSDVAGVLRVRAGSLDLDYIERWVDVLDLRDQWNAARTLAS